MAAEKYGTLENGLESAQKAIELAKGDSLTSSTAYWLAGANATYATPIAWHAFGFPAVVELGRGQHGNPEVPPELVSSYTAAIQALPKIALNRGPTVWGEHCFEPVIACLALSLGRPQHGRAYLDLTESEISEFYKYYGVSDL